MPAERNSPSIVVGPLPYPKRAPPRNPHVAPQFKPRKPGHEYPNNNMLSSVCDQYLRQMLANIKPETIDFDIAVSHFLHETSHLNLRDIPHSVDQVIFDFETLRPLVSRQDDVYTCALHIKSTIKHHRATPDSPLPFALRYPNLKSLQQLTINRSKAPRALPSDKAAVLVDLAGRLLVINLPPKYPAETLRTPAGHMTPEARALNAFEGAADIHNLPSFDESNEDDSLKPPASIEDFGAARLSRGKSTPVAIQGAVYGSLPYVAFGYSLGSPDARADTKYMFGRERQGWKLNDVGAGPQEDRHLPLPMGLGEESLFKRIKNGRIHDELHWPYEVSHALNASVNPKTFEVAERVVNFIGQNSGSMLSKRISTLENKVIQGQQINYNLQVAPHRDGKNSNLLDSVFYHGRNYQGGRLIFPVLGVSVCADPGYSVHARFKFLEHGVSSILPTDSTSPPLRISLALYSHAQLYASVARVSAARNGLHFSDTEMWLPFPPPNFSIDVCRKILRKQENSWRKKKIE
ncbi:uncharacterized protein MELLADRAFT_66273 [Melampsora larici-populina 98AG31]|uniref:Uncharacterized protein n=1 Tax=Melampsora larici-populina (strain 98AG31 / pathotype 3-4-7) TaxID=747676 RepID=F4RYJ0_MELLP|nr:uncharacterized protein MELLADRAFT_66273 [Melampsora larici-populina 98AG31]EGG02570.1 hypothetical protein MELLADRAFT_66273 [Melampsora larici-populina 98AG31]